MIKLGLIGFGKWGFRHIESSFAIRDVRFTHVSRPSNTEQRHLLNGVSVVQDWKQMAACGLDAVVIATDPASHSEIASFFLNKGTPVLIEKPVCLDSHSFSEIVDTSNRSGTPFGVSHIHLFSGAFEKLHHLVSSKKPGTVKIDTFSRAFANGPYRDYSALWDYGPHDLSMCLRFDVGQRQYLHSHIHKIADGSFNNMYVEFDSGSRSSIVINNTETTKQRTFDLKIDGSIYTYDDTISNKCLKSSKLTINGTPDFDFDSRLPLIRLIEGFVGTVKTGVLDKRFLSNDKVFQMLEILEDVDSMNGNVVA
jgi:predicted dehydrogenase